MIAKRDAMIVRRREFDRLRQRLILALIESGVEYACAHPGCAIDANLTIDHKIPLSRGGGDEITNLQFMCRSHNSAKRDKVVRQTLQGVPQKPRANPARRYLGLIDGSLGSYEVTIPDLGGCAAKGKTTDDAIKNAARAAREWVDMADADGMPVPEPTAPEIMRAYPGVASAIATGASPVLITVALNCRRPAKANLSLDSGLLEAVDEAAAFSGLTRSAFIASAALEKIAGDV